MPSQTYQRQVFNGLKASLPRGLRSHFRGNFGGSPQEICLGDAILYRRTFEILVRASY
ncbi:hypothetical protein BDR07DRAFT_1417440 [Suillus spraguei]|nr:hypothetical protein BDR07DRAFT_1417440 [Suillus spraguei]